jgi:hypothetical protein
MAFLTRKGRRSVAPAVRGVSLIDSGLEKGQAAVVPEGGTIRLRNGTNFAIGVTAMTSPHVNGARAEGRGLVVDVTSEPPGEYPGKYVYVGVGDTPDTLRVVARPGCEKVILGFPGDSPLGVGIEPHGGVTVNEIPADRPDVLVWADMGPDKHTTAPDPTKASGYTTTEQLSVLELPVTPKSLPG